METLTLVIDDDTLYRLGSSSLFGLVLKSTKGDMPKVLVLKFYESSFAQCRDRGGPHELIIAEYNVPCLLIDVLALVARGVEVRVEYVARPV